MATLTVRDLRKSFAMVEVLKGIDLEAESGEFIALVGPSGCGKSTLLAMIAGLEPVTSGEILIGDRLVNSVEPKDRDIAMVFQSYALYPTMTVRENMRFGMESRGVPKQVQEQALQRVASLLQIEPLMNRKPGQLSGGQRQRVAMGRALVRDPVLFLFDEPLSNLDAKLRVEMRTEIKKLHQQVGKTTIYVTHDQIEAMTLASRIAVMHRGEVQQFDKPEKIYNQPVNMFVASFMGSPSMNFIAAEISDLDGQAAVTFLSRDQTTVLPLGVDLSENLFVGRKVIFGVRPEHLAIHTGNEPRNVGKVEAEVIIVEPTGADTMAIVRIGDQEISARFQPDTAPNALETVTLAVDCAKINLFDPESEKLIWHSRSN